MTGRVLFATALAAVVAAPLDAQPLDGHCVVSILNRTAQVRSDGSWDLPNIPAGFGPVRARATCVENGVTRSGESEPFTIVPGRMNAIPPIVLGRTTPIPTSLEMTASSATLTTIGATTQLTVTARYANGSTRDVTAASTGTRYVISNAAIASLTSDGLAQALSSGTVLIQATHEGTSGFTAIQVVLGGDSDGDGIPDDVELALDMNPNNAADALQDMDRDGLSNADEYRRGTNLRVADTDGDGLTDGDEVRRGTNPALRDTDGDGVSDGLEVSTGTDPRDPNSVNFGAALSGIDAAPDGFTIIVNSVIGVAYTQLRVTGQLRDGTTVDLTSTARGTNYTSSDLNICNFGAPDGRVFGGADGACTITVRNSGFQTSVTGSVTSFSPRPLGSIAIPGYANNVDVNGSFAYVAAGSTGLRIVNVSDPAAPAIVGSVDTPGNANDVRVVGSTAYVADGNSGLTIIDVTNPLAPSILSTFATGGEASDVFVTGTLAYVANGSAGVQIVSVANPRAPLQVRSVDTPGYARGVAVSGNTAVVADQNGLRVIDVTNPSAAALVGTIGLDGESIDVDLSGSFAYVAAYTGGVKVVDVGNPSTPLLVGSLPGTAPQGFVPRDVQVAGTFAIFAEQLFANAIAPIVDITLPTAPSFRGFVDFGQDYAGTGIAVSGPYVYWTGQVGFVGAENGVNGTTRLFIGQYLTVQDLAGVPPTVVIDSPADGTSVVEGTTLTVRVTATDDVAVSAVTFLVDGEPAFTDTSQPYEYTFSVPMGASQVVLGARATDLAGNVGSAGDVTLTITPDPLTTVRGRVVDAEGNPAAGATVSAFEREALSGPDGTFAIASVPTVRGPIVVTAELIAGGNQLTGSSAAHQPVPGDVTDVGTITIANVRFETDYGTFYTNSDDTFRAYTLPFTFRFYGTDYATAFVGTNGYITFNSGDSTYSESLPAFSIVPRISASFDDWYGARNSGVPTPGVYVNASLPGRFVVTHDRVGHFSFGGVNTFQITLYSDGRILFAYKTLSVTMSGMITGLTPGPNAPLQQMDFSATPSFTTPAGTAVLEYFTNTSPFDLANKGVMFTPLPEGGYSVRVFDLPQ